MKKFLVAAALSAAVAAPAMAADMPVKAPPPPVAVAYAWSGFYVGAHVGGIWGTKDWHLIALEGSASLLEGRIGASESHDLSGWLGGVQGGFNVQSGQWVFGVEAQWSWTNAHGDFVCDTQFSITCRTKVKWVGTVAGRVGMAFDRMLAYVKGGAAFVSDHYRASSEFINEGTISRSHNRIGWMVGSGLEVALAGNWTGKIEYNYMDFGTKSVTFGDSTGSATVDIDQVLHVVKFGINYRFGGPVVARY